MHPRASGETRRALIIFTADRDASDFGGGGGVWVVGGGGGRVSGKVAVRRPQERGFSRVTCAPSAEVNRKCKLAPEEYGVGTPCRAGKTHVVRIIHGSGTPFTPPHPNVRSWSERNAITVQITTRSGIEETSSKIFGPEAQNP